MQEIFTPYTDLCSLSNSGGAATLCSLSSTAATHDPIIFYTSQYTNFYINAHSLLTLLHRSFQPHPVSAFTCSLALCSPLLRSVSSTCLPFTSQSNAVAQMLKFLTLLGSPFVCNLGFLALALEALDFQKISLKALGCCIWISSPSSCPKEEQIFVFVYFKPKQMLGHLGLSS